MKHLPQTVLCHDIDGGTHVASVDQLSFRPSVYGVVVQDSKVLLSRQWEGYDFPGGAIELGETIEEALVREVREETGLIVKQGSVLATEHDFFNRTFALLGKIQEFSGLIPGSKGKVRKSCSSFLRKNGTCRRFCSFTRAP